MLSAKIGGKVLGRLADDDELQDDGIVCSRILKELFLTVGGVPYGLGYRVEDVLKVGRIPTHSGVASRRIASRMKGLIAASVRTCTGRSSKSSMSCLTATRSSKFRPGSKSIKRSTSLSGRAVPRANEPKIRTRVAPCSCAIRRTSARLSMSNESIAIAAPRISSFPMFRVGSRGSGALFLVENRFNRSLEFRHGLLRYFPSQLAIKIQVMVFELLAKLIKSARCKLRLSLAEFS